MRTLSLSLSPSLSFNIQIQTIRLCSLYSLASSLDSRVIFGLYRPFRAFLMMYFDSKLKYSYDYGVHLPLTVSAILVLYNVTCYIYMRNFAIFCILVWLHMDAHQYVFFFQNLNILCIFSDRFFSGSGFLGRSVLVTFLFYTFEYSSILIYLQALLFIFEYYSSPSSVVIHLRVL